MAPPPVVERSITGRRWRWRDHDPVVMIDNPACQDALRSQRLLFMDCGKNDQFQLHLGMRLMRKRLDALGIPYEAEEFEDDHRSISYRYDVSVPKLASALTDA